MADLLNPASFRRIPQLPPSQDGQSWSCWGEMGPRKVARAGPAGPGGSVVPRVVSILRPGCCRAAGSGVRSSSWGKNISLKCKSSYFRLWPCCLPDVSLCWTRSESHLSVPQVLWSGITAAPAACTLPASWGCVWSLQVWQKCLALVKKINVARKVRSIGLWKENSDVCQSILIGYKFNQRGRQCKDEFLLFCTVESVGLSQKLTVGSGEPDLSIEIFV